jgi:hypothetical protein
MKMAAESAACDAAAPEPTVTSEVPSSGGAGAVFVALPVEPLGEEMVPFFVRASAADFWPGHSVISNQEISQNGSEVQMLVRAPCALNLL